MRMKIFGSYGSHVKITYKSHVKKKKKTEKKNLFTFEVFMKQISKFKMINCQDF